MSEATPTPDYGEVRLPGIIGRLLGRPAIIVREANVAAALATLPAGSTVERTDTQGHWVAFLAASGDPMIRFQARVAWLAAEPTIMSNKSDGTAAAIQADGTILVYEGLHRTRATARDRILVQEIVGEVLPAPGWLDFKLVDELPPATPSTRAIMALIGGDPDAPSVRARRGSE